MLEEMVARQLPSAREPAGSDRLPVHRSESQPAIPRRVAPQQSPLPLHRSPAMVAQSRSSEAIKWVEWSRPPPRGVSSLLCALGDISILRRHDLSPPGLKKH